MTTNPSPDAVEALTKAIEIEWNAILKFTAVKLIGHLAAQGFTITRQPAMTDAELEREAYELADAVSKASCKGQISAATLRNNVVSLAKKYRG